MHRAVAILATARWRRDQAVDAVRDSANVGRGFFICRFEMMNPKTPRHESSSMTSWCLRPLPPFTRPRSRIRQYRPLLMRASRLFAKWRRMPTACIWER